MTGGDAVVAVLRSFGVRHVFGIISVHNLPIFDALARDGSIMVVSTRHEQGAVHAADGYARATGELGVAITSTGPGAANAVSGLYEAAFASSRVLMVTGQIDSQYYGMGKGCYHEADRQLATLRSVTRTTASVNRTGDIAAAIRDVIVDIHTGRAQPGAVEIPIDLQHASAEIEVPDAHDPDDWPAVVPDRAALDQAAALLAQADRPLLWAGGGVVAAGATVELTRLAEHLSAPVVTSLQGRGAIAEDHPLAMGATAPERTTAKTITAADVVLAVGTRFQEDETDQWGLPMPGQLVHIDADRSVLGRNYQPEVGILGDARLGLQGLLDRLRQRGADGDVEGGTPWAPRSTHIARVHAERDTRRAEGRARLGPDHVQVMDTIREHLPRSGIVVRDATVPAYMWGDRLLPIYEPRTSIYPTSGAVGPGLALAIGATLGARRPTVLIQGDGGAMFGLGELATARQYDIPLVICLFNDRGYGVLRTIQDRSMGGRRTGVDLATPDFAAVGRACGLDSVTITDVEGFRSFFPRAVASGEPWLLDIDLAGLAPLTLATSWSSP
ncbi:MAG: thiamine pyrophosphate-binding protein [Acidimicrobiales bacterium]